jgi:hypothetical protein
MEIFENILIPINKFISKGLKKIEEMESETNLLKTKIQGLEKEIYLIIFYRSRQTVLPTLNGLDIIGNYLTEINITSPTGIVEIEEQTNFKAAEYIINAFK